MKQIYILLTLIIIFGCSASKNNSEDIVDLGNCKEIHENNFSTIKFKELTTITDRDTVIVNELRFECVKSIFYTNKAMFDNYGKWNVALSSTDSKHPVLMWTEVDLFSNGKKYQVFTKGRFGDVRYVSVMVFNLNGKDLLTDNSTEKDKIITLFSNLIRSNKTEADIFLRHYWNAVDPKIWKL